MSRRIVALGLVLALVGFVGWQRFMVHEPKPGPPFTVEASYGQVEWLGDDVMIIHYVRSTWQSFQRLSLEPGVDAVHVRALLTQVDNKSIGAPTSTLESETVHVGVPAGISIYVGNMLIDKPHRPAAAQFAS
jgi:hypothetical protein